MIHIVIVHGRLLPDPLPASPPDPGGGDVVRRVQGGAKKSRFFAGSLIMNNGDFTHKTEMNWSNMIESCRSFKMYNGEAEVSVKATKSTGYWGWVLDKTLAKLVAFSDCRPGLLLPCRACSLQDGRGAAVGLGLFENLGEIRPNESLDMGVSENG